MQNPYQTLGLPNTATDSEIRLRFRDLIADASSDIVRFEALKAAFDALKDPDARHQVDVRLSAEAAAERTAHFSRTQMGNVSAPQAAPTSSAIITSQAAEQANRTMAFQLAPCALCGTPAVIGEGFCTRCGLQSGTKPGPMPGTHSGPELHLQSGQTFKLAGTVTIGRDAAGITLPDASVSRLHATITVDNAGNVSITEAGSTNGTLLDGQLLRKSVPVFAQNGSTVQFGAIKGTLVIPVSASAGALPATPEVKPLAVAAAGDRRATLLAKDGRVIPITDTVFTVGRRPGNLLCITDDQFISGMHAELVWRNGQTFVVDKDSTNGTFVNDHKLPPGSELGIASGDRVKFGATTFLFRGPESA
jgi:pSer/pThr/pTyr-binding forkhead associated (FHA) protein